MATIHNKAAKSDIAKTVLMPGDPMRSKFIADNYLQDAQLVNDVRGVNGYTGYWEGVRVTVMASGMGMPSIGIYSWELYTAYGVQNIIRIGTTGAFQDDIKLRDVILAQGACANSSFVTNFGVGQGYAAIADHTLLCAAEKCAAKQGLNIRVGNVLSDDMFYYPRQNPYDPWKKMGVLSVEMEAAALYTTAAYHRRRALCICTVTDHLYRPDYLSAKERQTSLDQMIRLALDTAVEMENVQ